MFDVNSFDPDLNVQPLRLLDMVEWASLSDNMPADARSPHGVLALPPLQRSAVWKPSQIIDLWDSVLRGLPIGAVYLMARKDGKPARGFGVDASNQSPGGKGWDILDGQQRIRTLLLGVRGPCLKQGFKDKRCIWIELADTPEEAGAFRLRLTSEGQPFGYPSNGGNRLSSAERRAARTRVEPCDENGIINEKDEIRTADRSRRAYDYELFEGFIDGSLHLENPEPRWKPGWPPLPYSASRRGVYPLNFLLAAWLKGKSLEARLENLRNAVSLSDRSEVFIAKLHEQFCNFDKAKIAVLTVDIKGDDNDLVLRLFERIGAGGVVLTDEEKLFSTYKFYQNEIHDTVNDIYNNKLIGHALPPVKIVTAAIRIANARSYDDPESGNWIPTVDLFLKDLSRRNELESGKVGKRNIAEALSELLGPAETPKFLPAFENLFEALALPQGYLDGGLPKVMMTNLSPRLLEVLLFWAIAQSDIDPGTIKSQRDDLLRFVMFWRLCVTHEAKASTQCFIKIRAKKTELFPAAELCDAVLESHERIATPLLRPDKLREIICGREASHVWRTDDERFPADLHFECASARRWWESGKESLLWLQREYLQKKFGYFDPTSGRDDETPYDLDHMIPSSDWGRNWTGFKNAISGVVSVPESMRESRNSIGQSIGNKRLIDYTENRSKSDANFAERALEPEPKSGTDTAMPAKTPNDWADYYRYMAFDAKQLENWRRASGDREQLWPADRLAAFQQAVEERAAWLYDKFYLELGFASWQCKFDERRVSRIADDKGFRLEKAEGANGYGRFCIVNLADGARVHSCVPDNEFSFSLEEAEGWLMK